MTITAPPNMIARLPAWAQTAQEAIDTQEVQDMIKRLGDFNLAVCMPHMHPEGPGGTGREMTELPPAVVQVERDLVNTFVPASEATDDDLLPVAWRWEDGVVACAQTCPHE